MEACEKRTFEECLKLAPTKEASVRWVMARIEKYAKCENTPRILDVGAASGLFVIAAKKLGYECEGIEPFDDARLVADKLSKHFNMEIVIKNAYAEQIPYPDETFDVVCANSVVEHVIDVEKVFSEICRVLKPGGVFWFSSASAMNPFQGEIRGYPFFGWYPDRIKLRIMENAKEHKPHLVGHTDTPAINWFTPHKANRLLRRNGFSQVYDRWQLRRYDEGGIVYKTILRLIKWNTYTRLIAEILMPGCSYAAIK